MLRNVLAQNEAKLAAEARVGGATKIASVQTARPAVAQPTGKQDVEHDPVKVAQACYFLAEHLGEVVDDRSPQEKLAEHYAFEQAMLKQAGANNGELTSTQATPRATADSIPPATVSTGTGGTLETSHATAEGIALEPNKSGAATKQPPKTTNPSETGSAPTAARTAMPTNMASPSGAGAAPIEKIATDIAQLVKTGKISPQQGTALYMTKTGGLKAQLAQENFEERVKVAMDSGLSRPNAEGLVRFQMSKLASDVDNPAHVGGDKNPLLQKSPDANPAQSQGQHAEELADQGLKGSDQGRNLISDNMAAINATRRDTKAGPKAELKKYLTEPALSGRTDTVLSQTLDNAPAAGVKIASGLRKWASQNPENMARFRQAIKEAHAKQACADEIPPAHPVAPEEEAPPPAPAPDDAAATLAGQPQEDPLAMYGVSPEQMAQAEALLAQLQQGAPMGGATPPVGGPPPAMGV